MIPLEETNITCPYCGERVTVLLNREDAGQEYIEDCQVCCRPIIFNVFEGVGETITVAVRNENETY